MNLSSRHLVGLCAVLTLVGCAAPTPDQPSVAQPSPTSEPSATPVPATPHWKVQHAQTSIATTAQATVTPIPESTIVSYSGTFEEVLDRLLDDSAGDAEIAMLNSLMESTTP